MATKLNRPNFNTVLTPAQPDRRRLAFMLAAVVLIGPIAAGTIAFYLDSGSLSAGSAGIIHNEDLMTGDYLLAAVAEQIGDAPADHRTGAYTELRTIVWDQAIQGPVEAAEQRSWHTPDGTQYLSLTRSIDDIGVPAKDFDPIVAYRNTRFDTITPHAVDSREGGKFRPDLTLPGGSPATELTWMLDTIRNAGQSSYFVEPGTRVRIDELVDLYYQQAVPRKMRQAILYALANLTQVTFTHTRMRDAAEREGIGFSATADHTAFTIIIDPATGELLAVQQETAGKSASYTLFFPARWTDQFGPALTATPVSTIIPTQTAWPTMPPVNR
ncbi:hypothetical protein HDA40_002084 [Hamadaea flava]|uniref:Uncharacterized protein n=1 Tax=Hamadaea flava TaxID=1742688 RepID=A0ABV8LLD7_9ACTN|nr:hypothetical protein [Hamadaea flava]MCP2323577.1 hypothetical protein [Hamadaea flava]